MSKKFSGAKLGLSPSFFVDEQPSGILAPVAVILVAAAFSGWLYWRPFFDVALDDLTKAALEDRNEGEPKCGKLQRAPEAAVDSRTGCQFYSW